MVKKNNFFVVIL